jgi:Mini-chromosome maintenance protein 2
MGVLDQYDENLLDDREYDSLDPDARAQAEAAMADRDRREGRFRGRNRIAAALESDDGEFRKQIAIFAGLVVCCLFYAQSLASLLAQWLPPCRGRR